MYMPASNKEWCLWPYWLAVHVHLKEQEPHSALVLSFLTPVKYFCRWKENVGDFDWSSDLSEHSLDSKDSKESRNIQKLNFLSHLFIVNSCRYYPEFDEESDTDSSSDMSEYGWENDDAIEGNKRKPQKQRKFKRPLSLDQFMDVMDKELAITDVGKSFEKQANQKKETPKPEVGWSNFLGSPKFF